MMKTIAANRALLETSVRKIHLKELLCVFNNSSYAIDDFQPRYRRFPPKAVESHVIYRVATIGKKFNMADFSSNCFELKIYAD